MISRFFLVSLMVATPPNSAMIASPFGLRASKSSSTRGRPCVISPPATPPVVEGTHGQLCTRLTDGLCRDDADCLTDLNRLTGCHVGTVALRTHTDMGLTGQDGTDLDGISAHVSSTPAITAAARFGVHIWFASTITTSPVSGSVIVSAMKRPVIRSCNALDGLLTIHECLDLHIRDLRLIPAAVHPRGRSDPGIRLPDVWSGNQSRRYAEPYRTYLFELRVRR